MLGNVLGEKKYYVANNIILTKPDGSRDSFPDSFCVAENDNGAKDVLEQEFKRVFHNRDYHKIEYSLFECNPLTERPTRCIMDGYVFYV